MEQFAAVYEGAVTAAAEENPVEHPKLFLGIFKANNEGDARKQAAAAGKFQEENIRLYKIGKAGKLALKILLMDGKPDKVKATTPARDAGVQVDILDYDTGSDPEKSYIHWHYFDPDYPHEIPFHVDDGVISEEKK